MDITGPSCGLADTRASTYPHVTETVSEASDEYQENDGESEVNPCDPCQDSDDAAEFVSATAFCFDCMDYMYNDCIKQHRSFKKMKDHKILEGEHMPRQKPRDIVKCTKHPEKPVELYCQKDDALACRLCYTVDHNKCEMKYIAEASKGFADSEELAQFQMVLEEQEEKVKRERKLIGDYEIINNKCCDTSIEEFHTFKEDIEARLNRMEDVVSAEAGESKEKNKTIYRHR